MPLRDDQVRRYARHVLLPDVGGRGQERLLAASVVVELGRDGAAEAALVYLAAAGVGRLVLAGDLDGPIGDREIAGSILYGAADRGRPRGTVAAERIAALNPDVIVERGSSDGALRLADEIDPPEGDPAGGLAVADALARAGAAATRLLRRIAGRGPA